MAGAGKALWELTAAELAEGYQSAAFTPVDVLAATHRRVNSLNASINAIITEDRTTALAAAEQSTARWRQRQALTPLDGVPLTVKDNIHVAGLRATWGSRAYAEFAATEDEPAVERLRAAGAIILGKTNVPEFTVQGYTENEVFGPTTNPIAPGRTPGGSTGGGAAAVAAGFGPLAIGTDGGGSLRRPASHCGLFALKPSIGEIPRFGGFRQILSDFEVIGPIGRTLQDVRTAFAVMRGADSRDGRSRATLATGTPFGDRMRIGYFKGIGDAPVDPSITQAADRFVRQLGDVAEIVPTAAPFDAKRTGEVWGTIAAVGLHWEVQRLEARGLLIGEHARSVAQRGAAVPTDTYLDMLAAAADIRASASRLFDQYDLLLCPTTAALAWPATEAFPPVIDGRPSGPRGHAVFTGWMNVAGLPAVSLPVGLSPEGGGIGVQLVAAPGRDLALLDYLINLEPVSLLRAAPFPKDPSGHE